MILNYTYIYRKEKKGHKIKCFSINIEWDGLFWVQFLEYYYKKKNKQWFLNVIYQQKSLKLIYFYRYRLLAHLFDWQIIIIIIIYRKLYHIAINLWWWYKNKKKIELCDFFFLNSFYKEKQTNYIKIINFSLCICTLLEMFFKNTVLWSK